MTTTTARPRPTTHRALGWAAALGTLPYLTLKALWVGGSTVGATDAAFLHSPEMVAANSVTFVLDLLVIALAVALTHDWGRRVPVWALLLPVWVGTGFLVPMACVILPAVLLHPGPVAGSALAPWVGTMVYGGFAWQGVFLAAAFVLHVRGRWAERGSTPALPTPELASLLRVVAGGGTVMAVLSAGLNVAAGDAAVGVTAGNVAFAVVAAAGVQVLVRGGRAHRAVAAAAAWTGSAAMFSWGLYAALLTMGVNPLGGGGAHGFSGLAQLTGLLGGFALAVAGLLALVAPSDTSRNPRVGASVRASRGAAA